MGVLFWLLRNEFEIRILLVINEYFEQLNFNPKKYTNEISNIFKDEMKFVVRIL